ncbi:MAG: protein kinase [Gemmatimonadetes bacterium]|nr:protein kinase [Gemmatimonadota bacterium]
MTIRLLTLGRLQAIAGEAELEWLPGQRLRAALLVYLAVERRVSREGVTAMFWPETSERSARHALRQSLYHLRVGMGDGWLETRAHELRATPGLQCDVQSFEAALARQDWVAACDAYTGPFLDGVHLVDLKSWESWVDRQRARLARAYRKGCRAWTDDLVAKQDLAGAIAAARRWVEQPDPLYDEAQGRLIELLAMAGDRTEAIRQYEVYARLLETDGLQPIDQTRELIERLREAPPQPPAPRPRQVTPPVISPPDQPPAGSTTVEPNEAGAKPAQRQLAAIMFTDIAEYTALMQADEQAAVAAIARQRTAIDRVVARYDGRLIQSFGDGTLSIFPSAVQAVRAAVDLQQQLRTDPPLPVRIGVHQGEIAYDGDNVYGDSVNIASRIHTLAVPGSVVITEKVFDDIKNHPTLPAVHLGQFSLRNVTSPVTVYALAAPGLEVPTPQRSIPRSIRGEVDVLQTPGGLGYTLAQRLNQALLPRYATVRELGRGGAAIVFLTRDSKHERDVALKVLRPELTATLAGDRFLQEIRVAASLKHRCILQLYDSGAADGLLYYVMPCVEGGSLRQRLDHEGRLEVEEVVRIALEACDALGHAHDRGVIHRDVKPENILFQDGHVLIADFGIARAISAAAAPGLTDSGVVVGTPAYLPPEQASGQPVDARSDVYSLGCVVYEMLVGKPAFVGQTPQSVIARQGEPPPSLDLLRPGLPAAVVAAVEKAMANVPADRFASAADFAAALERTAARKPEPPEPQWRLSQWLRDHRWTAVTVVAAAALLTWVGSRPFFDRPATLDAQRVAVFPLSARGADEQLVRLAEDITATLTIALNSTQQIKAQDASRHAAGPEIDPATTLPADRIRALARQQRARFAVDGMILVGDSIRAVVNLHDVLADSASQFIVAFAAGGDPWPIGIAAAGALLPRLIPAGTTVDLTSLSGRSLAASTSFLQGEQAYRRAQFADALALYQKAVQADSGFALAALRGAQAASWNHRQAEARSLIQTSLANRAQMASRYGHLALGVAAFLNGRADSAVAHARRALDSDSEWLEPWMLLGEAYTHWLPSASPLDSLARAAFLIVEREDSTFAPALYHLTEIALRRGELSYARDLLRRIRSAEADSVERVPLELMLRCVERPGSADWRGLARKHPQHVFEAARSLAVSGLRQPACAEAAWRALVEVDSNRDRRFSALLGLQNLLVATGRDAEVIRLLESDTVFDAEQLGHLYILDATAGAALEQPASVAAAALRNANATTLSIDPVRLWFLGTWEAHTGQLIAAREIADSLAARAVRSGDHMTRLLARSMEARVTLGAGDSARALQMLRSLVPTTDNRQLLAWYPWEALGAERILFAELLLARGHYREALDVSANFDAPAPVSYLVHLPRSLEIRTRAAEALGHDKAASAFRARIAALRGVDRSRAGN